MWHVDEEFSHATTSCETVRASVCFGSSIPSWCVCFPCAVAFFRLFQRRYWNCGNALSMQHIGPGRRWKVCGFFVWRFVVCLPSWLFFFSLLFFLTYGTCRVPILRWRCVRQESAIPTQQSHDLGRSPEPVHWGIVVSIRGQGSQAATRQDCGGVRTQNLRLQLCRPEVGRSH